MAKKIDDETIEYIGILSKLELSEEERQQAGTDMGKMLDYIDKMQELDTEGVEPISHIFRMENVFREDVVTNADAGEQMLVNAPRQKDNMFVVPPTF
ncbi:MAG: Asp-tRNA(Asn)/Glu-tRNA(Gln) amidotransferase subunit GatC [Acetatifactor sp.]|nr:Asp-tRNA(Asn)/Glu-tRNA(Gln) amidotransferase subunit GatC [Acetatifactor sp.]